MTVDQLALWVPLAPLIGAAIAGFGCRVIPKSIAHIATIAGVAIAFILSCLIFQQTFESKEVYNQNIYTWMSSGLFSFHVGFLIDNLTTLMMLVVSFVSLMVHIYTIGYMRDDPGYSRFFAYISLFTFAMLMLVMSNNFMQLFFGWEAVGLVSYLLIGFWHNKPTAIFANMKAFLVNRVGDLGFILGIGLILVYSGSLDYYEVFDRAYDISEKTINLGFGSWQLITVICICLFIGAMGKSAQVPLHVWLPDSMEGPTPISALIHAATMVTAGIFMVSRMSPLFEYSPTALSFVMIIGAITALFMGFLGIIQNDIKRVVAYSTLSQLGYMTVALGASAYSVAIFHLMTHAFFKALLFLAAGSVIIAMHHEQDIRKMGGLRKYLPITWITSLIGSLALIGTPFLSGFYSKDSIIEAVKFSPTVGSGFAYFAVLAGVFVTAFYSFRMYFLVFHGEERFGLSDHEHPNTVPHDHNEQHDPLQQTSPADKQQHSKDEHTGHDDAHHHDEEHHGLAPGEKPHETPWVVWLPLVLLAIPSLLIGYFTVKPLLFGDYFQQAIYINYDLHRNMDMLKEHFHSAAGMALHGMLTVPFFLAVAGVLCAWLFYIKFTFIPKLFANKLQWLIKIMENKYYFDRFNEVVLAGGARFIGKILWLKGDTAIIDRFIIDGGSALIAKCANTVRKVQSGLLYHYVFMMIIGLMALLTLWVTMRGKY